MQFKCLDELPGGLPVTRCTRQCSLRSAAVSWCGVGPRLSRPPAPPRGPIPSY